MNSFISWVGGKMALRDEILTRFPLIYKVYVEVFGGAGWVLFHKRSDTPEIFNDYNANLVNLYRIVKQDPEALITELDWSLNSRSEFELLKKLFAEKAAMNDVERAANFFKLIKYSYGSKCVSFACQPSDLERSYPAIRGAHRRLREVVIENKDFAALISQYDKREGAFFYLDPPYFGTEDYYLDVGFMRADHIRLRDALGQINGKFQLSYNDDPFIRELYAGYHIEAITRISNLSQRFEAGAEFPKLFIANYDLTERGRRLMHKFGLQCPIRKANPYRRMAKAIKTSYVAPNLLNREFRQHGARAVLLTDITYIPYSGGKRSYLFTVLDAYTKQVLAYEFSPSLEIDFVLKTVQNLIRDHGISLNAETLVNSDQGSHYTSHKFVRLLKDNSLRQSMSRRANCWDNAPQESLYSHMKVYGC